MGMPYYRGKDHVKASQDQGSKFKAASISNSFTPAFPLHVQTKFGGRRQDSGFWKVEFRAKPASVNH
jgi:hypothetical protein